ncbi:CoA transferase [Actinoallomurus sp. NBC_01490]|uniref:CaiB/BaiF CoA transferase family protein n=1 Tax=Actinoallomurus sp. NBC_01490 TaxID=2903557 RepID=UPI002E37AE9B|nr:CoA transferase [Actinoallomurus sp. NBC_01490]
MPTDSPASPDLPASPGPLADLRVVEMAQLIAGPFCGQLLGDFGAEVIKLEPPGAGDPMRQWGREKPHGRSLWWPIIARNKKSATCDLRTAEGQDLARRLIDRAGIVVENLRPGTLERWGLGFDRLRETNPGLVMVRVTGFGQTGPYAPRAGYGSIGEAMVGLRHVTGDPGGPPSRTEDGEMVLIAANQDTVFRRLAAAMERPDLAADDRYATHAARGRNMAELDALISAWTARSGVEELLGRLHDGGVPAGRIYTARDMFADPQFAAGEAIVRLVHPELGELPMQGVFPRLGETPGSVRRLGPALGEHNAEVYGDLLGIGEEERAALAERGVI